MDLPREQRPTRPSQSCAARLSRCTHGPGACPRMVHCDSASRGGSQSGAREGTHRVIRQQVICQLSCAQALVKIFCFICEITWLEMYEKWRCGEPVGVHGMATIFVTLAFFPESRHESCCRRYLRVWPVVAPCFLPPPRTRGTLCPSARTSVSGQGLIAHRPQAGVRVALSTPEPAMGRPLPMHLLSEMRWMHSLQICLRRAFGWPSLTL